MSAEQQKALVRRYYQAWSAGELDALDEVLAPSYLDHDPAADHGAGIAGVKDKIRGMSADFSTLEFVFEDQLAEANKVASRITIQATHTSGKRVTVRLMDFITIIDGKIVEEWGLVDALSLMQQLEALPPVGDAMDQ